MKRNRDGATSATEKETMKPRVSWFVLVLRLLSTALAARHFEERMFTSVSACELLPDFSLFFLLSFLLQPITVSYSNSGSHFHPTARGVATHSAFFSASFSAYGGF